MFSRAEKGAIKAAFARAKILIISTGAGMGKDSGLPTFRNEDGLWGQIENQEGKSIFEISNPQLLAQNPLAAWQYYALRQKMFAEHSPHVGFYLIKQWIAKYFEDYFVLTSNIDSFFQRAGFEEDKIRELHGSMAYLQCAAASCEEVWLNTFAYQDFLDNPTLDKIPRSQCSSEHLARPNIYMFRDYSFVYSRVNAQKARFTEFLAQYQDKPKLVLEIGSGPHVQSIRLNTRRLIKSHRAQLIRINPKDFKVRNGHIGIAKPALEALRLIEDILPNSV